jgi:hypothetical protein
VSSEKNDFPAGLQSLLRYHASIGISHYPRNEDVEAFLRVLPQEAGKMERVQKKIVGRVSGSPEKKLSAPTKSPVTFISNDFIQSQVVVPIRSAC